MIYAGFVILIIALKNFHRRFGYQMLLIANILFWFNSLIENQYIITFILTIVLMECVALLGEWEFK